MKKDKILLVLLSIFLSTAPMQSTAFVKIKDVEPSEILRKECFVDYRMKGFMYKKCANLYTIILNAAKTTNIVNMLNASKTLPKIVPDQALLDLRQKCMVSEQDKKETLDDECAQNISTLIKFWSSIDTEYTKPLTVKLETVFAEDPALLLQNMTEDELDQQAMFELFDRFNNEGEVFEEIYAMATALDSTFVLKDMPEIRSKDQFIQELLFSNTSFAVTAVKKINQFNDDAQAYFASIKRSLSNNSNEDQWAITKKIRELGSILPDTLVNVLQQIKFTKGGEKLIKANPERVKYYLEKPVYRTTTVMEDTGALKADNSEHADGQLIDKNKLQGEHIPAVYMNRLYANLVKILIYILSPQYIGNEKDFLKKFQNKEDKQQKNIRDHLNTEKYLFLDLDPIEYNKLKQIALVMLTNIHVLLVNEKLQRKEFAGKNELLFVARQIKDSFEKQLKFFSRDLFALQSRNFSAIDISRSMVAESFATAFLNPIYQVQRHESEKWADSPSLINASGDNIYALYATYLNASLYGVLDEGNTTQNVFLDRQRQSSRIQQTLTNSARGAVSSFSQNHLKILLSLIPIPRPPIISDAIENFVASTLTNEVSEVYNMIINSCVLSRQNCKVLSRNVVFNKSLTTRITEFLEAYENSLRDFSRDLQKTAKELKDPNDTQKEGAQEAITEQTSFIPTIAILRKRAALEENKAGVEHAKSFEDLVKKLIDRTSALTIETTTRSIIK
ncbi:MAG TPA: hypothetical protein DIC42_04715 [Holosporales bacterium]|nr:hypothetical protein [Holosporales bacterium]